MAAARPRAPRAAAAAGPRRLGRLAAQVAAAEARCCVVTGGSSGIGEAVCAEFARKGHRVISVARRPCGLPAVESIQLDLAQPGAAERTAELLWPALGDAPVRLCLVHCASNYPDDNAREVDAAGLERALHLNVTFPALLTAKLLPRMANGSSVIFVGSTLSEKAVPGKLSYCTAKHAMTGLMRAVAQDILWSGTHVALVCPGITDTEMVRTAVVGNEVGFGKFVGELQGRILRAEEVASFIWDASQSPILHGAVLHCNNGQRER